MHISGGEAYTGGASPFGIGVPCRQGATLSPPAVLGEFLFFSHTAGPAPLRGPTGPGLPLPHARASLLRARANPDGRGRQSLAEADTCAQKALQGSPALLEGAGPGGRLGWDGGGYRARCWGRLPSQAWRGPGQRMWPMWAAEEGCASKLNKRASDAVAVVAVVAVHAFNQHSRAQAGGSL